jgi:hypothetical protein
VVEHQTAAIVRRRDEHARPTQRQRERHRPLGRSHLLLPPDPPRSQHAEHAERDEAEQLVGLHHPVHGVTVGDVPFGLQPGEDGGDPAERADDQGPEGDLPEAVPPGRQRQQLEERGDQEQRGGQIVQRGVKARPVIAEHRVSSGGLGRASTWGRKSYPSS